MSQLSEQTQNLLQLIPESGSIGNVTLRKLFSGDFAAAKTELLNAGIIKLGRGKGGSVRRALSEPLMKAFETLLPEKSPETGQLEVAATEEF